MQRYEGTMPNRGLRLPKITRETQAAARSATDFLASAPLCLLLPAVVMPVLRHLTEMTWRLGTAVCLVAQERARERGHAHRRRVAEGQASSHLTGG